MMTMNEFVDLRMQQQIAHEIYRQQIMQRIPDPYPPMLSLPVPHHIIMPPRPTLPGVEAKLENNDLWKQFHKIGTEMIITKSGRRMFPSMRISLSGLDEESNYCVLLEMVPIGDCRYKFSGSQWVPAGGAEPQSPQRMFLHADSPATGAHWQAQAILFNKVKLTNNTLDSNGHIVLASMHKYQPRLHIIRTSDLTQLPWAPQQAFVFPETEFVAVTAYQNDRITKLKIDNNPFAKGFRESGQSRCKRKLSALNDDQVEQNSEQQQQLPLADSPIKSSSLIMNGDDDRCSSIGSTEISAPIVKRFRSSGSIDDDACSSSGTISPGFNDLGNGPASGLAYHHHHSHHQLQHVTPTSSVLQFYHHHQLQQQQQHHHHHQQQHNLQEKQRAAALQLHHQPTAMDLAAAAYFSATQQASIACHTLIMDPQHLATALPPHLPFRQHLPTAPPAFYASAPESMLVQAAPLSRDPTTPPLADTTQMLRGAHSASSSPTQSPAPVLPQLSDASEELSVPTEAVEKLQTAEAATNAKTTTPEEATPADAQPTQPKRNSFSISAILAY